MHNKLFRFSFLFFSFLFFFHHCTLYNGDSKYTHSVVFQMNVIDEDMSYFLDNIDDDYDEEDPSIWNYNDWLASSIEPSSDFDQYFDNEHIRLTSLSPSNSNQIYDSLLSTNSFPSDSSSSLVYSLIELTDNCMSPALSPLVNQLSWIMFFCCLFRLIYFSKLFSSRTLHLIQICSSIFILYNYFHFQSIFLLTYIVLAYAALQLCLDKCRNYLTCIIVCFSIIYVLACEFFLIDSDKWHTIRGVQMCIMMKMISLAIDYAYFEHQSSLNTNDSIVYPTAIEFFSYILSIHNTIFGPWMNYHNYIRYFSSNYSMKKIDFFELAKGTYYFLRVAFCLLISTCLTDWFLRNYFFSSNDQESSSNGWRIAYFQALSYRFSHYCVCFIGELCGQISGLEFDANEYRNYSIFVQQAKIRKQQMNNDHQSNEFCQINANSEHDFESIPTIEHSDIHRRHSKKSLTNNQSILTKRKLSLRSNLINSSSSSSSVLPTTTTPNHLSSIVKPIDIEIPRSLVDVVVNWNIPMHYWLKIYVYMPMKQQYGHFLSILLTYLASALLHGFNFQLSIVLFSIGLFAYVEYGFRRKLAHILDACVAARQCSSRSSCDKHAYTYWHPLTIIVNIFLCLLSLWHLTYLGQLFDGSSQETIGYSWRHVLDKWSKLNFASHLVVIATYVIFRSL